MSSKMALAGAFITIAWVAPLLIIVFRFLRTQGSAPVSKRPMDWRQALLSTLLCTLAFNLTFFIQELFLVLPKALVPGLRPTLFHNDHSWTGSAPIAELFEGTGAVAILVSGMLFTVISDRRPALSAVSLLALWMGFEGLFQALPQFVLGAILPGNDVGRAYAFLQLGAVPRVAIAIGALAAIPLAGRWLARSFLSFSGIKRLYGWRARFSALAQIAALPALASIPLVIAFRVPREPIEVVVLPLLISLMGGGWVLANAGADVGEAQTRASRADHLWIAGAAVLLLLGFFQLVLRHGIRFY